MNATELKAYARERGADLVGIAPVERFESLPPERHPLSIAPECRSVIVLARRILRGSLRGVEEGTNFGSTYGSFGYAWLEENFLSRTTYELTCWIEERGHEAVPLFAYAHLGMATGLPVMPGKPAPNVIVDWAFAAQAAGLAEWGLGDFLLSEKFGPRQRFALVLTDAQLDADPIKEKSVCGDCGVCAAACPFGAIRIEETKPVGVPGHTMPVATVDYAVCRQCNNGATLAQGRGDIPDRCAAACVRACIAQLEKNDKCANRFAHPFRKRKPWAVDAYHRPVPAAGETDADKLGCHGAGR